MALPCIVALQPLDKGWDSVVQNCVRYSEGRLTRLWSFEVKRQLNRSNVRECFFQAVSNSSWAHFGYLVATEINEDKQRSVEKELQMLCALHGIGVILLNPQIPAIVRLLFRRGSEPVLTGNLSTVWL